jgi:ABC-type molybdate transport system permease subunit
MNLLHLGLGLIAVGIVLALATSLGDFGWLLAVGGVIILVIVAVQARRVR